MANGAPVFLVKLAQKYIRELYDRQTQRVTDRN